ncbi:MAG: hypothetical protein WC699_05330 [Bacteroidales bacterium]
MQPKLLLSMILVVFLAGPALVLGQDRNEKKIERLQRKIEKQNKKLQELTGEEHQLFVGTPMVMDAEQIARIREKTMAEVEASRDQIREAMEVQRESMREQRQAIEEQVRAIKEQAREMQESRLDELGDLKDSDQLQELKKLKELKMKKFKGGVYSYSYPSGNFTWTQPHMATIPNFKADIPDVKIDIPEFNGKVYGIASSSSRDNLSINKNLTDESSTADFTYQVKEGATALAIDVNGAIDSGKVTVVIKRPDGEVYNEYTFSSLANVNYRQTVKFEGMEESQYLGKWTVSVTAEKAKGTYSVQLNGR